MFDWDGFRRRVRIYIAPSEESVDINRNNGAGGLKLGNNATLLDKQFNTVIPTCTTIYVLLQIAVGLQHYLSDKPICNNPQVKLSQWVHYTVAGAVACLLLTCVLQLVRIASLVTSKTRNRNMSLIKMNTLLFVLIFISFTSKALTFGWNYGGICIDALGVASPAAQWIEWLVLVPLLQYVALAGEQKEQLDRFDITMLVLLVVMVLLGYAANWGVSLGVCIFLILVSTVCLALITLMTYFHHVMVEEKTSNVKFRSSNYLTAKMTIRKDKLLMQLNIILWYYPFVYLLGAVKLIDADLEFAAYMLGSMFGKVIFASLVVESHITVLYEYLVTTSGRQDLLCDSNPSSNEPTPSFAPGKGGKGSKNCSVRSAGSYSSTHESDLKQSLRSRLDNLKEEEQVKEANSDAASAQQHDPMEKQRSPPSAAPVTNFDVEAGSAQVPVEAE